MNYKILSIASLAVAAVSANAGIVLTQVTAPVGDKAYAGHVSAATYNASPGVASFSVTGGVAAGNALHPGVIKSWDFNALSSTAILSQDIKTAVSGVTANSFVMFTETISKVGTNTTSTLDKFTTSGTFKAVSGLSFTQGVGTATYSGGILDFNINLSSFAAKDLDIKFTETFENLTATTVTSTTVPAVPEPGAICSMALGLAGLMIRRRRKSA